MISYKHLKCLSLHLCLPLSSTADCTPQAIESWFTRAAKIIALMWPRNPRYIQYFDLAKPLLQLSASVSSGAQFVGSITLTSRETPLELECNFRQVSAANDGSLYISTAYPCRKIAQDVDATKTSEPDQGTISKSTLRSRWKRQGGKIPFLKM
jgi:hypothetical protein